MSVEHRLGFGSTIPVSFRKNNWYANLNPQLFLLDSKISMSTSIRIQIGFTRPHVSGFILVPKTPLGKLATEHPS